MNIVIVEDELITAEDLKSIILDTFPQANIVAILESVKMALQFFKTNPPPDLIFSDIKLGDGLSFEIYQQVNLSSPIIFCTAYNEYALKAFDSNGIHYILKPFDEHKIEEALMKFQKLKSSFKVEENAMQKVLAMLGNSKPHTQQTLLVYQQDKVIPIPMEEIALFYKKNEITHLCTFKGKTFFVNKTLDEMQHSAGDQFYRANRQYIVNKSAVKELQYIRSRKGTIRLNIPFEEDILISKEKLTPFMDWLEK